MTTNAKDNDDDDYDDDDDDILKGGAWIQLILQSLAYHDHNDNQYDYDDYHIKYDDDDDDDNDILKGGAGIWLVLPEAGDDSNFGCSPLGEGHQCVQPCISHKFCLYFS